MNEMIEKLNMLIGNTTKLKICCVLSNKKLTLTQITKKLKERFKLNMYKDNIYRNLEKMLQSDMIDKIYDKTDKKIYYFLTISKIQIDFEKSKINTIS